MPVAPNFQAVSEAQHRLPLGSEVELAATAPLAGSSDDHSHPEKVVSSASVARGYRVNWSGGYPVKRWYLNYSVDN